jgi:S1-C subfamily serine protease
MKFMNKGILILAVIIFALAINLFSCAKDKDKESFGHSGKTPVKDEIGAAKAFEIQSVFRKIFDMNKDSVVFITTEQFIKPKNPFFDDSIIREFFGRGGESRVQKRTGLGTGFILSEDGYICTNHHVINGVDKIIVSINDKNYEAKIIGFDERTDIGLLKIEPESKLAPVFFGDSNKVEVGDWAIAIGNPFGLDKTFTIGVISAIGRRDVDDMGGSHIQTDASINPGNSGGPLINIYGEVIGINRMIYSQTGGYMGIGFAIPINTAKSILGQLQKNKNE